MGFKDMVGWTSLAVAIGIGLGPSAADASAGFNWDSGTTTLTASAASTQSFATTAGTVTCNEVSASASVSFTSASSVTTTSVAYKNNGKSTCPLGTFGEAEFKMNGCNYRFNSGSTTIGYPEETIGSLDIVCPKGAAIEIVAPFGACTIRIGPQEGLSMIRYETRTTASPYDFQIHLPSVPLVGFQYSHSGFGCGTGSAGEGAYSGTVTMKGETFTGTATKTWVE
jgi:hypothetical protein